MAAAKKDTIVTKNEKPAQKAVSKRIKKDVLEASVKPVEALKPTKKASGSGSFDVFDLKGKVVESIQLPKSLFEAPINQALMAQAVRVYLANQRKGTVSTKSRGEVKGSSRKIYKQKGTGRARHGSIRAPIFVHGGVVFGPKPRDFSLKLPQKMRRAALVSALTYKRGQDSVKVLKGLSAISPKTKEMVSVLQNLKVDDKKKKVLFVLHADLENIARSARNIPGVSFTSANRLNTYEVLNNKHIVFMNESLAILEKVFGGAK